MRNLLVRRIVHVCPHCGGEIVLRNGGKRIRRKRLGLIRENKGKRWTREDDSELLGMTEAKKSPSEIGLILGRTNAAVRLRLWILRNKK